MVSQPKQSVVVLRWLARLGSMASVALLFLFLFGEEMDPSQLTTSDILALLFFPFGVAAGMLLAWRWETLGGTVTVFSLLAFYKVIYATSGRFPGGIWFMLFALPGLIFLYCGLRSRRPPNYIRTV